MLVKKIRALRLKMGMTQQDLAGTDFTKSFISQIEKNHARPSLKSLQIIADRLGKTLSAIFSMRTMLPTRQTLTKLTI